MIDSVTKSTRRGIKRHRQVIRDIARQFPKGRLPEEFHADEENPVIRFWPWSFAVDGNGSASAGSTALDLGTDAPTWRSQLLASEIDVARLSFDSGTRSEKASKHLADRILDWFDRQVTREGLLCDEPWRTVEAIPALYRIREAGQEHFWNSKLEKRFRSAVDASLRTLRHGAVPPFQKDPLSKPFRKLMNTIVSQDGWGRFERAWNRVKGKSQSNRKSKPRQAVQSEEARIALLRHDGPETPVYLAVDYREPVVRLELAIGSTTVLSGPWSTQLDAGKAIAHRSNDAWTVSCWFEDSDGHYLELRQRLGDGLILERQLFLGRQPPLLWLADCLVAPHADNLRIAWAFATPTGAALRGNLRSRAQDLVGLAPALRLLPVGFPSELLSPATGRLYLSNDRLHLEESRQAARLFLPLVLIWSDRELPATSTWNPLSVTNDRRRVPMDEAVAYRIPHQGVQILFYRALQGSRRYAFAGYQTYKECVIGELRQDGELREWLMVEET